MYTETLREIKKMLRLRMNGEVSASMRAKGLNYPVNFGLDATSLRELAKRYEPSVGLSEALWQHQSRECRILAGMLFPIEQLDETKATRWLAECDTLELKEQLVFNLYQHHPEASVWATHWCGHPDTNVRVQGYLLMMRLLLAKKINSVPSEVLDRTKKDVQSTDFSVQLHASRLLERSQI
ncbi:MAG: DNA alkylation repair protein [Bacteroidales bacterium]|nr:DNA alkylation repair protein [Bacteroidales bacterium]MDD4771173.1 DNA alkylation repair protein [Bacteroidales bacterium]